MSKREEIVTRDKIRELEENWQDGLSCKAVSLGYHLAENAGPSIEPTIANISNQLSLHPKSNAAPALAKASIHNNVSITIAIEKYPIRSGERGEIINIKRYEDETDKADITVDWKYNRCCNYSVHPGEILPFQISYVPGEKQTQTKLPLNSKRHS